MKALLATILLLSTSAFAGEKFLGSIVSAAGADTTNATTASPFVVPLRTPISVQCTAIAYVITDDTTAVTSTRGAYLDARQFFTSKTSDLDTVVISSTVSAIVRAAGPAATTCSVWARNGDE